MNKSLRGSTKVIIVKSTPQVREDANGKLCPKVEECYRERNADGNSMLSFTYLPRCQHKHAPHAEQEDSDNNEICLVPVHFTGELHCYQGN